MEDTSKEETHQWWSEGLLFSFISLLKCFILLLKFIIKPVYERQNDLNLKS